ncbi:MAG: hypothetical protein F6K41_24605 [Symploca sp. SIO3E6]|nr:hypothetical protein [Caldora sp. SIO3E6]
MIRLHTPSKSKLPKIQVIIKLIFVICFALLSIICSFKGVAEVQSEVSVEANLDVLFFFPTKSLLLLGKLT